MARITASVYTSHVPAIGVAMDLGKTEEPYWQPLFKGYEYSRQWMEENRRLPCVNDRNDRVSRERYGF